MQISSIERSFDRFLTTDLRDRTSSAAGSDVLADLAGRLNSVLAGADTGLGSALDGFFAAVQDVANNPGAIPERQVLLGQGDLLADRFVFLDERLAAFDREVGQRLTDSVERINSAAQRIASLNTQIVDARRTGSEPNDLLDARDQVVLELANLVGVTTVAQDDGALNVFIGKGQSLVVGDIVSELQVFSDADGTGRTQVGLAGIADPADIGAFLTGGELGAALQFRNSVVDPARSQLGVVAAGITQVFNNQQGLGLDLNGDPGSAFFSALEPGVTPGFSNTGAGVVNAVISDVAALTGADYEVRFDGSDFTVINLDTGAAQTGAGPSFSVDGLEISIASTPAANDSFRITPTTGAAGRFAVALQDPRQIAAASPVRVSSSVANAGTGTLGSIEVTTSSGLPLATDIVLTFNPDALGVGVPGFDVTGAAGGPIAFDPASDSAGISVSLGNLSFELGGTPEIGDSFTIGNNENGTGDNRNALELADLQRQTNLLGGTASFQDAYAGLVGAVAVSGQQARSLAATEGALLEQAQAALTSTQGGNLDEEAANLIRYQQAYAAAAQVIAVADEVFQILLDATRR